MQWNVFLASVTGAYHLTNNQPCQDAGHYVVEGDVLIGVVCDGAGSAAEGRAGSQFFAERITALAAAAFGPSAIAARSETALAEVDWHKAIAAIVDQARSELAATAASQERSLRDFASTLVGCISSPAGGCFFHIGDGFAIHLRHTGESVLSRPENGEYADETYFVTDEHWQEHLRVTPLPGVEHGCVIGLMSDGTSPFAVDGAKTGFFRPFFDPVVKFLREATEQNGTQALQNLLADEKTHRITADDKTLLLALVH